MKKLVLDTNILVSALMKPCSLPARVYRFAVTDFAVYYSEKIMYEYNEVLYRKHFGFDEIDIERTINLIETEGTKLTVASSTIPLPHEDDRVFYDTAVSAGAYLVTGNMKHYTTEPFILTPADFLKLLE